MGMERGRAARGECLLRGIAPKEPAPSTCMPPLDFGFIFLMKSTWKFIDPLLSQNSCPLTLYRTHNNSVFDSKFAWSVSLILKLNRSYPSLLCFLRTSLLYSATTSDVVFQ